MKYTLLKNKATGARSIRNNSTGHIIFENENSQEYMTLRKRAIANRNRIDKDDMMRSCGLIKVKGAVLGKTYWE